MFSQSSVNYAHIFGDPLDMSIADKREYERWLKYARKYYSGPIPLYDKPNFFESWANRAWLGQALLESTPPEKEIAIEILKTIVNFELNDLNTSDEYLWELKINSLYSLGIAVWQTMDDINQALRYIDMALAIEDRSSNEFSELARGEVFYAHLLMLKEAGQLDQATQDMADKVARYDRQDDRTNSYLFFASLFKADLAKEQEDLEQALASLQQASRYYPFTYPERVKFEEISMLQEDDPEKVFQELREMMSVIHNVTWEYDGPFAAPIIKQSPLYKAISDGNTNEALRLISLGEIDEEEELLHKAAEMSDIAVVDALLKAGLSPNRQDRFQRSVLQMALNEEQSDQLLDLLLQAGADPDATGGWSLPLNRVIKYGSQTKVKLLLRAGANINQAERNKETPVLTAAAQAEILKILIADGADIHCQDKHGQTPLMRAAAAGNWEGIQLLWQAGADKSLESLEIAMELAVKGGTKGHLEVVKHLLELGVTIKGQGKAYLRLPAHSGDTDMIDLLIGAGADVNKRYQEMQNTNPSGLEWDSEVVERKGVTALGVAAQAGQVEAIKRLLTNGASVNAADNEGVTPLMFACNGGHEQAAHVLLEAGADIYAKDLGGETPASYALRRGSYLTLDVLDQAMKLKPVLLPPTPLTNPTIQRMEREQIEQQFNSLVGLKSVKKEFEKLERAIRNIQLRNQAFGFENQSNYNLIIEGEAGSGKYTLARIYANILWHHGIIKGPNIIKLEKDKLESHRNLEDLIRNQKGGVIYLAGIESILPGGSRHTRDYSQLDKVLRDIADCQARFIFIIAGQPGCRKTIDEHTQVEKLANYLIQIPEYSTGEIVAYAHQYSAKFGYQLTKPALNTLKSRIKSFQMSGRFENFNTIQKLIGKAIVTNAGHSYYATIAETKLIKLTKADFGIPVDQNKRRKVHEQGEDDPFVELEALIGLQEVKERVKEIAAYIELQKRRSEVVGSTGPLCLHMAFTGNPGTGKTTVARIIGKIFKKLNIFSKGHFVETSRVDLVGQYVGHTASKTANTIKTAMDGVLFIDEAYSLFVDSGRDFGREAVATLIKEMEDQREHIAVIFAGYSAEMEQFININPGLRDRIQFKIDFPDYTGSELLAIFEKLCQEEQLCIEIATREVLIAFFERMSHNKGKDFANGRLARKCFERVKLAQAKRLFRTEVVAKEELVTIATEDVQALYSDLEIIQLLKSQSKQIKIGFGI